MIDIVKEEKLLVVSFIVVLTLVGILVVQKRELLDIIYFIVMFVGFIKFLYDTHNEKQ